MTPRKGGIGSLIALMVIVALLLAAVVLMVNVLNKQVSISQRTVQAMQKQQLASEVTTRISACFAVVKNPLAGYQLVIKTNNVPAFCQYVKAIQAVMNIDGSNTSLLFPQTYWLKGSSQVYYSACTNNYKVQYVTVGSLKLPAALILNLPATNFAAAYKVQMLLTKIGWKALPSCLQTTGAVSQVTNIQQTTTIFSIGPITVLASGNVNPLQYICPPPKTVVGDDYAYEIALVLNPQFNGTRNNVPTSVVLDLKDIIEKAAPASSPLKYYINDVYLRNITVMRVATTPNIYQISWGANAYLPWSYTFLNLTKGQTPLQKSVGVLTFNFTAPAPMTPNSLVQYSAVVCLYLGIAGQYPPSSKGVPFDGKIFQHNITIPGLSYSCASFSGYDVCYAPVANLTTPYATNETSSAGMKFEGLQYPVDSTVRTYKITVDNPNDVPLYDQLVRVKLPPQLNGTNITLIDQFGGKVAFCYETIIGNCTSVPVPYNPQAHNLNASDGYIWVKVPYIPAGGTTTLSVIVGKNGASSPYDVFPVYVDFAKAKIKVDRASWTWNFPGYAFTSAAAVFPDTKGVLDFVSTGNSFTVAAVVRWDGAFNFDSEDTVNYIYPPTWPDANLRSAVGRIHVGYWLYPIAYAVNPTTGTGWMLALYQGLPVIIQITNDGAGMYLKAAAAQTLIPGIKYLIIAGYDNTTNQWSIYLKPLQTPQGQSAPAPAVTVGANLLEEINQAVGTTGQPSLMYTLFSGNTPALVISDASRYYDLNERAETIGSFSGVIYNVTVYGDYASPTTIEQCLASYNPSVCPPVYAHTNKANATGLYAYVKGTGDELGTIYQLSWYVGAFGISFPNLIDWNTATVNSLNPGSCLPLVGAINITVIKGIHVVKGTFFGTPLNGQPGVNYCTPLGKAVGTISKGIINKSLGAIVLNSTWLGQSVMWNFWLQPVVPKGTYYEVRTGMNGGSYGQYGGTTISGPPWARSVTYNWAILYPYVSSIVSDGLSWLKWMIYEDNSALYRFITSRNGLWGDAWRIYLVSYASEPVAAVTSPSNIYYNINKYDLSTPLVYFDVYQGGPLGTLFYHGTLDLSNYGIASTYTQLLPKQVKYIGFSYMDASNTTTIGAIGTDTRLYFFMFARTLPKIPLEDYVNVQAPDLVSPNVDAPIVYVKKKGYTITNVTGLSNATLPLDVLGNTSATLRLNYYGAYANLTSNTSFTSYSNFTKHVVAAAFWNHDLKWNKINATKKCLPVSNADKWTIEAFNATTIKVGNSTTIINNLTFAVSPTNDYMITFNNLTAKANTTKAMVIGLSNGDKAPQAAVLMRTYDPTTGRVKDVDGILSWSKMNNDVSELNKMSIIMTNKRQWHCTISGPYCIKCS